MTKEELWNEAKIRVDAFINTLSQDIRGTLYDRLNQEDVKDFLYGLYIDSAEPREKRIEELEQKLEQTEKDLADYQFNYPTIKELEQENRLLGERCTQLLKDKGDLTDKIALKSQQIERLEKENAELKKKIGIYQKGMYDEIEKRDKKLTKAKDILQVVLDKWKKDRWILYFDEKIKQIENLMEQTEQFLKEIEK